MLNPSEVRVGTGRHPQMDLMVQTAAAHPCYATDINEIWIINELITYSWNLWFCELKNPKIQNCPKLWLKGHVGEAGWFHMCLPAIMLIYCGDTAEMYSRLLGVTGFDRRECRNRVTVGLCQSAPSSLLASFFQNNYFQYIPRTIFSFSIRSQPCYKSISTPLSLRFSLRLRSLGQ